MIDRIIRFSLTALLTMLGQLPVAISHSIGAEIQRPLAGREPLPALPR